MEAVAKKFEKMGARLKVSESNVLRSGSNFEIDVKHDKKGEFFDIKLRLGEDIDFDVVQVKPKDRHLLLQTGKEKFLCGHDERHWFVAGVSSHAGTVEAAKESLKPKEAADSQRKKRVKKRSRNKRRNAGFIRQGEWFFIPCPDLKLDESLIMKKEPLVRSNGGKPHVAEELIREGGKTVYVCRKHPEGISEKRYQQIIKKDPDAVRWGWTVMRRDMTVYVRGKITHSDHKTLKFSFWHRVAGNMEVFSHRVVFLD